MKRPDREGAAGNISWVDIPLAVSLPASRTKVQHAVPSHRQQATEKTYLKKEK